VPELSSYDYAVVRVVPSLDRGEFLNVGVILHARNADFLGARIELDERRLDELAHTADVATIRAHLDSFERIAAGGPDAGAIGRLDGSGRFHWLVAPRSTVIQTSAVHSGLTADPGAELDRLFERLVTLPPD